MVRLYGSARVAVSSKQSASIVFGNRPHLINETYVKDCWHSFLEGLSQTKPRQHHFHSWNLIRQGNHYSSGAWFGTWKEKYSDMKWKITLIFSGDLLQFGLHSCSEILFDSIFYSSISKCDIVPDTNQISGAPYCIKDRIGEDRIPPETLLLQVGTESSKFWAPLNSWDFGARLVSSCKPL